MVKKKNQPNNYLKYLLYTLITVTFVIGAGIILFYASGNRLVYENGKVSTTKTGMIIVTSRPSDGRVYINDKKTKYSTGFYLFPTKLTNLLPKTYNIKIIKAGYRTWENNLEVLPNLVTWANYALLFPEKIPLSKIDAFKGAFVTNSQNGRYMLFSESVGDSLKLTSYDTNNISSRSLWPTSDVDTALKNSTISEVAINNAGDKVVLKAKVADKTKVILSDDSTGSVKVRDLTQIWNTEVASYAWNPFDNNEIYFISGGNLFLANINDASAKTPILNNVVSYSIEKNKVIYYVSKSTDGTHLLGKMSMDGGNKQVISEPVKASSFYKFAHSSANDTLAFLVGDTGELMLIQPANPEKKTTEIIGLGYKDIIWSKDGQKLSYRNDYEVSRLYLEKKKTVSFKASEKINTFSWYFDDAHYLISDDKNLYVIDFDGANKVALFESPISVLNYDLSNFSVIFKSKDNSDTNYYKFLASF